MATYDPSEVTFIYAGETITGFADGTFISVDKAEDDFSQSVGATGSYVTVRNRNESGTITFILQPTSSSNAILSGLRTLRLLSNTLTQPLLIKDGGTNKVITEDAVIKKLPTLDFAKDSSDRTWVIESGNLDVFVGTV